MVGMHTFGSSAPLKDVMNEFGFTPDKVAEAARARSSAPPGSNLRGPGQGANDMKPTQKLHELGQSLWVDNITREMLRGHPRRGTSRSSRSPDSPRTRRSSTRRSRGGERLRRADRRARAGTTRGRPGATRGELLLRARPRRPARRRRPLRRRPRRTGGVDGFVSLEVSPLLADDAKATIEQAAKLHAQGRAADNLFIKIPGTPAGADGDRGVDLRRHPDQRHAALRRQAVPGRRRRLHEGDRAADRGRARPGGPLGRLDLHVSRWDVAVAERGPRGAAQHARHRRSPTGPTGPTATCSPRPLAAPPTRAPGPSACSGRAPGPRTPTPRTPSTSRPSPPPSRSTRCPSRRCTRSPITASSAS